MKETWTQSKAYLVPLSLSAAACSSIRGDLGACSEEGAKHRQAGRRSQHFLFDAGATLPSVTTNQNDWSGTGFLFEWYAQRGIVFDAVYAWEPKTKAVSFKAVPDALMPALHFYPDPVTHKEGAVRNPAALIKKLCKPEDVVIFKVPALSFSPSPRHVKRLASDLSPHVPPPLALASRQLDVDSEKIELSIMDQIVNDPELLELVDEFFFEMHVCNRVMRMHGMDCTEKSTFHVSGWYDVAIPAREKGMRMHFWP